MNEKAKIDISSMTKDAALTALIQGGKTFKEASAYWKENGTQIRGGIYQATLDFLAEAPRTQTEFAKFVIENGTKNEARWFAARDAIRRLSIQVRNDSSFKEVAITEAQKTELKSIVEGA